MDLRSLHDGWTPETTKAMTSWYEGTRGWTGGAGFAPFVESIYRDCASGFPVADKKAILDEAEKTPLAATALTGPSWPAIDPTYIPKIEF